MEINRLYCQTGFIVDWPVVMDFICLAFCLGDWRCTECLMKVSLEASTSA